MRARVPLILLLLWFAYTVPLGAQTRETLRSGSTVRLVLRSGPPAGHVGAILGRSGDSVRVIAPGLGLAEVALGDVDTLQVEASDALHTGVMMASGVAGAVLAGALDGAGVGESVVAGSALAVVIMLPASADNPRRWRRVDPAASWRGDPAGVRVRVSAPAMGLANAELRLLDFRSDTLYLREGNALSRPAIGEITKLELSLGHDRKRGVRVGSTVGAVAGVLGGGSLLFRGQGQAVAAIPVLVLGAFMGRSAGALAGYLLAPREWRSVPLPGPAPVRP